MSDQALENALNRRGYALKWLADAKEAALKAQADVSSARAELDKIDAFIALWHEYAGSAAPLESEPAAPRFEPALSIPLTEPRRGKRVKGNPKKEDVALVAREIIEARGVPVPRSDLFAAVQERGLIINGADPEMVFGTMLWRLPLQVVRLPEHGYWLADRPYAPAAYHPSLRHDSEEDRAMALMERSGTLPKDEDGQDGESEDLKLGQLPDYLNRERETSVAERVLRNLQSVDDPD